MVVQQYLNGCGGRHITAESVQQLHQSTPHQTSLLQSIQVRKMMINTLSLSPSPALIDLLPALSDRNPSYTTYLLTNSLPPSYCLSSSD